MAKKIKEDDFEELKGLLEDIKSILLISNYDQIEKSKKKLLKSGSLEDKIYKLCDGDKQISDISKKLGKPEKNVRARLSDLRQKGLIKTFQKNGKIYHRQAF